MTKLIPVDCMKSERKISVYLYDHLNDGQKEALLKKLAEFKHVNDPALSHVYVDHAFAPTPKVKVTWLLVGQKPIIEHFKIKYVEEVGSYIIIPCK
jgi:hypothetical protein